MSDDNSSLLDSTFKYTKVYPYHGSINPPPGGDDMPYVNLIKSGNLNYSIIWKTLRANAINAFQNPDKSATLYFNVNSKTGSNVAVLNNGIVHASDISFNSLATASLSTLDGWAYDIDGITSPLYTIDSTGWYSIDFTNKVLHDNTDPDNYTYDEFGNITGFTNVATGLKTITAVATSTSKTNSTLTLKADANSSISISTYTGKYKPYCKYEYSNPVLNSVFENSEHNINLTAKAYISLKNNTTPDLYDRIFLKFTLPNINGRLQYALLMLIPTVKDDKSLLAMSSYCGWDYDLDVDGNIVNGTNLNWDNNSNILTMLGVFNKLSDMFEPKEYGFVDSSVYFFDLIGYLKVYSTNTYNSLENFKDVKSIGYLYDQFNVSKNGGDILEGKDITFCLKQINDPTPGTLVTSNNFKIGNDNIGTNSLKTIVAPGSPIFEPQLLLGIVGPKLYVNNNTYPNPLNVTTLAGVKPNNFYIDVYNNGYGSMDTTSKVDSTGTNIINLSSPTFTTSILAKESYRFNYTFDTINTPGNYSQTYKILTNAYNPDSTSMTRTVNLEVLEQPYIVTDQNSISKVYVQGTALTTNSFKVWDGASDTRTSINYNITENCSFITNINPTSGSSDSSSHKNTHIINYTTSGLSFGSYNGSITITDNNLVNKTKTITATFEYLQAPYIVTDQTSISKTYVYGTSLTTGSFQVWDGTTDTRTSINYSLTENCSFISSIVASSGTSDSSSHKNTHTINYTIAGLTPGVYSGNITVYDPNLMVTTKTISVTFNYIMYGFVVTNVDSISNSAIQSQNASDQTFQVWNGSIDNRYPIHYTITKDVSWISSIVDSTGTSSGPTDIKTHTIHYDTSGLSAGVYTGHITISDNSIPSTKTITVTLTITDGAVIATDKKNLSVLRVYNQNYITSDNDRFQVWDANDNPSNSITYTITDDVDWITGITPNHGTSTGSLYKTYHYIDYDLSIHDVTSSTKTGTITITDNNLIKPTETIGVSYEYVESAVITSDTNRIDLVISNGQLISGQTEFSIWDSTLDTRNFINYRIYKPGNLFWLSSILDTTGTSSSPDYKNIHTLTFNFDNLGVDMSGNILIYDQAIENTSYLIPITLTVLEAAAIATDTTSIEILIVDGEVVSISKSDFNVWDSTPNTSTHIDYELIWTVPWILDISPNVGTSNSPDQVTNHSIVFDFSNLTIGTYNDTISIHDPNLPVETININIIIRKETRLRNFATYGTIII